jgi:hypothetical protein
MRALNFYSSNYHNQLLSRQKTCTIRLGDKSYKYAEGDIVWVTVGKRFSQKKKLYTAIIDRVLIKPVAQLTTEDLRGENTDFADNNDLVIFMQSIYDKSITPTDTVTVIYFSEIIE